MFEYLDHWEKILVTGPQRSGTRICTKMIAEDTGYWPIHEEEFGVDSLNRLWHKLETSRNVVIQAPAMMVYANLFGMRDPGLGVVVMRRDVQEIRASEVRIGWRWEKPELIRCFTLTGNAAEIRYQNWDQFQKQDLGAQAIEVKYEDLEAHPLWVPKEQRARFHERQTQ